MPLFLSLSEMGAEVEYTSWFSQSDVTVSLQGPWTGGQTWKLCLDDS